MIIKSNDYMDRNRLILAITFLLAIASTFIGIINISYYSTDSKFSPSTGRTHFRDSSPGAAVIRIEGEIHSGRSSLDSTGSDTVLSHIRDIEKNSAIKGILLEINSPGGSVAASQEIYNALMDLKESKKIVVSMKDVAASGGYYLASTADVIFAQHGTITGSIGVISVVPNIAGLLSRYGVTVRTYKQGKYKDMMSMFRNSTGEEDRMIQKLLSDTYNKFIEDVAKGRNRTVASIEELAEGKIYSGEDAFRNKLVDELGGRKEAHLKLSKLCQYEGLIPLIEIEESPMDRLFKYMGTAFNGRTGVSFSNMIPVKVILPSAIRFSKNDLN